MPLEAAKASPAVARTSSDPREPQVLFAPGAAGGALTVHPAFAEAFARLGLTTASAFLDLPGEVVNGHPDRHVVRVELPGAPNAFYLKRHHMVGWREKLRNRLAGFGWAARCAREAEILRRLEAANLPAPRWAAFGAHGGRAFLLVEEVPGAVELRRLLSDNGLSPAERRALARNLGAALAAIHAAGFTTPDLTAKHVLVNRHTLAVTIIDWPSARFGRAVGNGARADALGALHASLADMLAPRAERARVLRAYCSMWSGHGVTGPQESRFVRLVLRGAARHAGRRAGRDRFRPEPDPQRLVWLAGEAVCAVPEIAAVWPRPAVAPPFYGFGPDGASRVRIAGRDAVLVRGRASDPLGRFRAWVRAAPWRSPGANLGRVLFHLERYGVPAPRLFAFGQRLTGATRAEWFALFAAPPGILLRRWRRTASAEACRIVFEQAAACLQRLHDAGCVLTDAPSAFAVDGTAVSVADPLAVRIVRRVSAARRRRDLRTVARLLGVE